MKEIFLVEDDNDIREMIKFILSEQNYKVQDFPTAGSFYKEIVTHHPDLILLDIRLPDGDGINISLELKNDSITSMIPILLMSAHTDGRVLDKSKANDFISKPFDINQLIETINRNL